MMKLTYNPGDYKILIVDDAPKNLQVLGLSLKEAGYQVQFATSGVTALEWLETHSFDLVLLDVMMPQMDGFEVCRIIRTNAKHHDLPIIYLTANTDLENTVKGLESGAQDYVTKPFRPKELISRIKTQIELKESKLHIKRINSVLEDKVKQRTQQLLDAQKQLLNLEKAKSDFLSIISHEIRTPLNVILGFTTILKTNIETESLVSYVDMLEEAAQRLELFSLDALLISSLQLGNYKLNTESIAINQLITDVISSFGVNNGVALRYNTSLGTDTSMSGDISLIKKSLTLLIDNAKKVSPDNATVDIDAMVIDQHMVIKVTDYGPGFSDEALSNLYGLFSNPDKHVDQNMGIGLALVKLIVTAHNAEIEIVNNAKGASVLLKFNHS